LRAAFACKVSVGQILRARILRQLPTEAMMADNIEGISVANDGEAVKFGIRVDSVHHFCIVSREVLKELSQPGGHKTDLLEEFERHRELINEKAALAIRNGLKGDPLPLTIDLFLP
jgi:hypothetical protein